MTQREIRLVFSPPSAPHFEGAWERLIKLAKPALNRVLNGHITSEEILTTVMSEVEALLNGRPLTHLSVNASDPEALTPNHFLLARASANVAPDTVCDADFVSRKGWRIAQVLATQFWRRWLTKYLPNLIERKWLQERTNLKMDDVVIIVTSKSPRGLWPLGRVIRP